MSISKEVAKIIESDLSIQNNLSRGLINHRALARHILNKHDVKASLDGIISAIRRIEIEPIRAYEKKIENMFKDSTISTRNNLICFTVKPEAILLLPKILSKNIRLVTGNEEIKIIAEKGKGEYVQGILSGHILKVEKDLGEVCIKLDEEAAKTSGVLSRIANEISLNKINIIELLISVPEFLIFVKQKDVIRTHQSLLELSC